MKHFTFERVTDEAVLVRDFNPLFVKTFPDKNDREPLKELKARLADPRHNRFHLLRDEKGAAVGMELINIKDGVLYMPYASMRKDLRNQHIYPKFSAVSDRQTLKDGAKIMFIDIEDPRRLDNLMAGYEGEDPNVVRRNAENREHFWRRQGFFIVDDPELKYIRASSDDPTKIQAYDNLTFRVMDENAKEWQGIFNADKTAIKKSAYRSMYLELNRAQYNLEEKDLRATYPAIDQFLTQIDKSKKEWVSLLNDPIRPNLHPETPAKVAKASQASVKARMAAAKGEVAARKQGKTEPTRGLKQRTQGPKSDLSRA